MELYKSFFRKSVFFKFFLYFFLLFWSSQKIYATEHTLACRELLGTFRQGARYWESQSFHERERSIIEIGRLSVSQRAASIAAGKIFLNLKEVGEELRNKNLRRAYMYLNDGSCFEGTYIKMLPHERRTSRILEVEHFNFSQAIVDRLLRLPQLNSDIYFSLELEPYLLRGIVSISEVKIALGPVEYSIWEKRFDGNNLVEAVRLNQVLGLFEEKAHALQHLNQVLGNKPYIRLNSEEVFEVEKMQEELNREKEKRGESSVIFAQEADVYAFMFDLVGSGNLPKSYGYTSGYLTRAIIDRNRGRPWTEKEWEEALDEYDYNPRLLP
jgi:hypothetical protein